MNGSFRRDVASGAATQPYDLAIGAVRCAGMALTATGSAVRVFDVPERVDAYNTRELMAPILEQVQRGARCVVLDFSKTQAMDSTALGALVQVFKALRAEGGELRLACVGDAVARVLSITRLDHVFRVYNSVDAACSAHYSDAH